MKSSLEAKYSRCHSCQHSHSSGLWHPNYDYKQQRLCDLLGSCGRSAFRSTHIWSAQTTRLAAWDQRWQPQAFFIESISQSAPSLWAHTQHKQCRQWARLQLRMDLLFSYFEKALSKLQNLYSICFYLLRSKRNAHSPLSHRPSRANFLKKPSTWSFIDLIQQVSFRLLSKWPS